SATMSKDGTSYRTWTETTIRLESEVGPIKDIEEIIPRPGGRAWVRARDQHYKHHVLWVGPKAPAARIAIGSEIHQRNKGRHARGVRTWVGHCPQLFVSLGDRTCKSTEEIRKAIGSTPERVALVEGKLGGKHAAGVLLWRDAPETKDTTIEAAANALVKHFA